MSNILEMARVAQFKGWSETEWFDFISAAKLVALPDLPDGCSEIGEIDANDPNGEAWFELACDQVEGVALNLCPAIAQVAMAASARQFLRALVRAGGGTCYHSPVWEATAKVRDDFSFLQVFCALLRAHLLWT